MKNVNLRLSLSLVDGMNSTYRSSESRKWQSSVVFDGHCMRAYTELDSKWKLVFTHLQTLYNCFESNSSVNRQM
jgi:hypothetical protein